LTELVPNNNPNVVLLTAHGAEDGIRVYPVVGWAMAGTYEAKPITPFQFNRDAWALHDRQAGVYWDPDGNFINGDDIGEWLMTRASKPQRRRR
jgi:hypothetical protein